jgi:[ribosomal protein S18]-alanine N-acetyltransferase
MRRSIGLERPEAPDVEITRMRRRHLRGVMAIERRVYPRPWSPNLFVSEMTAGHGRAYLVALEGRQVVGYAGLISYGEEAHVTTIAVDPERQRRKVGTRLLFELLHNARALGAHAVSLEVRVTNWGAQRMYARFGFRPVGIRKGYYQETNEDAVVMWTDDIRTPEYERLLGRLEEGLPEARS